LKPSLVIEKPDALVLYEQIKSTGVLLNAGGLLDQPYVFMLEYAICAEVDMTFAAIKKHNEQQEEGK